MNKIFEQGVNTRALFTVEINDEGGYFAVRHTNPRFCLPGKTILEACSSADAVLRAYKNFKHKN